MIVAVGGFVLEIGLVLFFIFMMDLIIVNFYKKFLVWLKEKFVFYIV